ncbi:MAG: NUDIX hydrolase [Rhodobacteraceae bacterium]|nr:NUDIX hydrolase [Paracoccaceae bacterium]
MRRFGRSPEKGRRYKLRPGAYAILAQGSEMLVTHQMAPWPEFQLPGGGVDPGEQPVPALMRECLEETGWSITRPVRLGAFRRFTYMPEYELWAEKLCTIYLARPVRRLGPPLEEGHTAVWMPAEVAAEELAVDGDSHFVRQVFGLDRRSSRTPLRSS